MHPILSLIAFSFVLSACMGATAPQGPREPWRQSYDDPPVYDLYFGDAGNPVDLDPVFFETDVLYAD